MVTEYDLTRIRAKYVITMARMKTGTMYAYRRSSASHIRDVSV